MRSLWLSPKELEAYVPARSWRLLNRSAGYYYIAVYDRTMGRYRGHIARREGVSWMFDGSSRHKDSMVNSCRVGLGSQWVAEVMIGPRVPDVADLTSRSLAARGVIESLTELVAAAVDPLMKSRLQRFLANEKIIHGITFKPAKPKAPKVPKVPKDRLADAVAKAKAKDPVRGFGDAVAAAARALAGSAKPKAKAKAKAKVGV